jgi:hypothetical protein
VTGDDASNTAARDTDGWRHELAEMELQECHQHYRAATDQVFKALAFLATAIAVLITVAIEQQSALALAVTAIIPTTGYVIANYIGRQFGAATSYGALLERLLHQAPAGFFWGHLRSANPDWALEYQHKLESEWSDGPSEHSAWVTWVPVTRFLPWASLCLVVLAPIAVLGFDREWV